MSPRPWPPDWTTLTDGELAVNLAFHASRLLTEAVAGTRARHHPQEGLFLEAVRRLQARADAERMLAELKAQIGELMTNPDPAAYPAAGMSPEVQAWIRAGVRAAAAAEKTTEIFTTRLKGWDKETAELRAGEASPAVGENPGKTESSGSPNGGPDGEGARSSRARRRRADALPTRGGL